MKNQRIQFISIQKQSICFIIQMNWTFIHNQIDTNLNHAILQSSRKSNTTDSNYLKLGKCDSRTATSSLSSLANHRTRTRLEHQQWNPSTTNPSNEYAKHKRISWNWIDEEKRKIETAKLNQRGNSHVNSHIICKCV